MYEYIGENFQTFEDHSTYFLTQDALKSVSFDLWFSPAKKYYCGSNCTVCYIKDKLAEGLPFYDQMLPDKITDAQTEKWYDVFKYFYVIRTNDDLSLLKSKYPHIFEWYREHGHLFEYGMTDNAILAQHDILMNDLSLKGLGDVSMSDFFLNRINSKKNYNKVLSILQDYMDKYDLCKIKIIRTEGGELQDHVIELVDWLNSNGVKNSLQSDLRNDENSRYGLDGVFEYQNTYTMNARGTTYQIYREAIHLFNDRFFYSIDDATDIRELPFHIIGDTFDPMKLLSDMLKTKLLKYDKFGSELDYGISELIDKFKHYYINTKEVFVVNDDFNFIPTFMLDERTQFYHGLLEIGFVKTKMGLYKPGDKPKALVEFREA